MFNYSQSIGRYLGAWPSEKSKGFETAKSRISHELFHGILAKLLNQIELSFITCKMVIASISNNTYKVFGRRALYIMLNKLKFYLRHFTQYTTVFLLNWIDYKESKCWYYLIFQPEWAVEKMYFLLI